jgi:hypothetical protein
MAGTIEVRPKVYWSAASWLFYWILQDLIRTVRDPATVRVLEEIDRENLGFLALHQLSDAGRAEVLGAITGSLVDHRDRIMPPSLPGRDHVLEHLRELVELARES